MTVSGSGLDSDGIIGEFDRERLLQVWRARSRSPKSARGCAARRRHRAWPVLRHRGDDRLVERLGFGREILVPAHQFGEPVVAGGKPHGELVHGGGGGGLRAALDHVERIVQRPVSGSSNCCRCASNRTGSATRNCARSVDDRLLQQRQRIGDAVFEPQEE